MLSLSFSLAFIPCMLRSLITWCRYQPEFSSNSWSHTARIGGKAEKVQKTYKIRLLESHISETGKLFPSDFSELAWTWRVYVRYKCWICGQVSARASSELFFSAAVFVFQPGFPGNLMIWPLTLLVWLNHLLHSEIDIYFHTWIIETSNEWSSFS